MNKVLAINDLSVSTLDKSILKGINLSINSGEIHAIMGPNGSGKTTLAYTLMGHPAYEIQAGKIEFCNEPINDLSPDKRAKLGIFLAFQYPLEIDGLELFSFLRQTYNSIYANTSKQLGLKAFKSLVEEKMDLLKIDPSFASRSLNFGFSGGEKKRMEMLQVAILNPKLVILDEIDSGLDIDALKTVCECLKKIKEADPSVSILIITHYKRILNHIRPDFVHVMQDGVVKRSGDLSLAEELELKGYERKNQENNVSIL